jgi:hypothetical protein
MGARPGFAQTKQSPLVRLAELEIDPAQLQYTVALKEEIGLGSGSNPVCWHCMPSP